MAAIRKRGATWRAEVARNGTRKSATFDTKSAAQQWATKLEAELMAVKRGEVPRKTVHELMQRYKEDVSPSKRGARWEMLRLGAFQRESWAQVWAVDLRAGHLAKWRDERLRFITPGSVQRDFNLLHAVFMKARKEWAWLAHDPMDGLERPGNNKPRTRRVQWHEARAICRALGWPGESKSCEVARAFLIALRTGMRCGEIISLTPETVDVQRQVAHLTNTKNGDDRDVPMTRAAARLFIGWGGWTVTARSVDTLFRKARDRCGIVGLHFHDSRAEALTRLSRKVDALTLAKISGHRDLGLLLKVYYRPSAEQIAQRLG